MHLPLLMLLLAGGIRSRHRFAACCSVVLLTFCMALIEECCCCILQGEIMVATNLFGAHGGAGTLSRITLALMQDSGWYDVNWGEAGGFEFECVQQLLLVPLTDSVTV
jgi:hypothetical protein